MKAKAKIPQALSEAEETFALQLKAIMPELQYQREFRFCPGRDWRADFHIPRPLGMQSVLIEMEGAVYAQGRHTRGKGYEADISKYNEAALMGFLLLRATIRHVRTGELMHWVMRALGVPQT